MIVSELIAQLQKLRGDEIVMIDGGDEVGLKAAGATVATGRERIMGGSAFVPVVIIFPDLTDG
jgi:hypothetical protein